MTLREKLHKVYETVSAVEKLGENKAQNYKYVRSADVTHAIRKQLIELRVYAEINFKFAGPPFTIARSKDLNAPFSAVIVECSIVFHDLDTLEVITSSGLGTGCDNNDKAAYKAQTGALKYALKNAFLVPDEEDPEADETVDEDSAPKRAARPTQAPVAAAGASIKNQTAQSTATPPSKPAQAASTAAVDPALLPTEAEMDGYRKRFSKLSDELKDKGGLKANGLPRNRKIHNFLLEVTGSPDANHITKSQWDDFFQRADHVTGLDNGWVGLAKLVNKANKIEDTK